MRFSMSTNSGGLNWNWLAKNRREVPLESGSQTFFLGSSESNPKGKLRLEPGQWITAKIRFAMDEKRNLSVLLQIQPGKPELRAHWRQARYTWHRDGARYRLDTSVTTTKR